MVTAVIDRTAPSVQGFRERTSRAAGLGPRDRAQLSVEVLARTEPVSHLAHRHQVSRQFLYRQAHTARAALDGAFGPATDEGEVLYQLPVTKTWLRQFVLAQVLIGHSSLRGIQEILEAVFDHDGLSLGTLHAILHSAVTTARALNAAQPLTAVRVGAHDEIFQAGQPVLVGADLRSTYCYLLAAEAHRDETTWGVHLLDLQDQGLRPDYTVADGGLGLRAGQAAAWGPTIPCHGDVFHAERELGQVASFLAHRAAGCTTARRKLEAQMEQARRRGKRYPGAARLAAARRAEADAQALADDLRTLADWMQHDILSLAGPDLPTRRDLFDFVVDELRQREARCPHRLAPLRRTLQAQRDDLLAFAGLLDERFADLALALDVPLDLAHAVCELEGLDRRAPAYAQRETNLRVRLPDRFDYLQAAVRQVLAETPRASSLVENLNSRLRNYFFLRRHLGNDYLELLRFFLNHRRFRRSERPERVGHSPTELLTGQPHAHWLELLGFQRFHRN